MRATAIAIALAVLGVVNLATKGELEQAAICAYHHHASCKPRR